ncbi:MAG: PIN domain-containing protein [Spirochaetaceae bacterium]|nr:PIN domain-containing protein [Spirochaetaceae bacterium]
MISTVLIDAGPLIALFDRDDKYHHRVRAFLEDYECRFVSTLAVLTEVSYMLNFSVHAQIDFLEWILRGGIRLEDIRRDDIARIITLVQKYHDVPMDFADATLVAAAEKTGIRSIISLDSDFDIYRLPGKVRIHNIFSFDDYHA